MRLSPSAEIGLLLRDPALRRYFLARTASVIGSQWTYAAVPLVALVVYRDPGAAGIASACGYGGNIAFGLIAGFLIDRLPHRTVLLVADFVRFGLLTGLGLLLSASHLPPVAALYAIVALVAVFSAAFDAANGALAPRLVEKEDYPRLIAMNQTRDAVICMIMPIVSAALVVREPGWPFFVDGCSYLVSFILIRTVAVRAVDEGGTDRKPASGWRAATLGFSVLANRPTAGGLVLGSSVLNFGLQVCVYVSLFRAVQTGHASWTGVVLGLQAVGMFTGSLVARALYRAFSPAAITAAHALTWASGFVVLAALDSWWAGCLVLPALWMTAPAFGMMTGSHMTAVVPATALGRVYAASGLLAMGLAACSQTSAAFAVGHDAAGQLLVTLAFAAVAVLVCGVALPVWNGKTTLICHGR